MNLIKNISRFFALVFSGLLFGQQLSVINASATGRFSSCDNTLPEIIVSFVSSDGGTSVQNGSLIVNNPCGFTTLNITINGIKWYTTLNSNWIHGLFFLPDTPVSISNANLPQGWILQDSIIGAVCSAQEIGGTGFYYDGSAQGQCCSPLSANDGDASNNYGDSSMNCNNPFNVSFNLTFCNSSILDNQLDFKLKGTADGNTGCFSTPDVLENFIQFSIPTQSDVPLYSPFPVNTQVQVSCVNDELKYSATLTGGCGNGSTITWWSDPVGGIQLGTGSGFVYTKPDGSCPAGEIIYAQCCPPGLTCSRYAVQIMSCPEVDGDFIDFPEFGPYCQDSSPPLLPTTSNNGISGSWSPSTIDTSNTGVYEYTFTPDSNCYVEKTIEIEITPKQIPLFELVQTYCLNSEPAELPETSNNGIHGSWSPAVINTGTLGTSNYTFTADSDACSEDYILTVTIVESGIPTFGPIGPFCQNTVAPDLPLPLEGVNGVWSPSVIDTSQIGVFPYTFTPVDSCFGPVTIEIEIVSHITPVFNNIPDSYCQGSQNVSLPNISSNGVSGTWSPSSINTAIVGIYTFTFTPDQSCADIVQVQIEIKPGLTPKFNNLYKVICLGAPNYTLPSVSDNGISGTWLPAVIETGTTGVFPAIFTPDPGLECAETISINFKIVTEYTPTLNNVPDVFCQGSTGNLPNHSSNGVMGTWSPTQVDTSELGTSTYIFTPDPIMAPCVDVVEKNIEVIKTEDPTFGNIGPYCESVVPNPLPSVSNNGYTGTWNPPVIDTSEPGTYTYTFTPDEEWACSNPVDKEIVIKPEITPEFHLYGIYCQNTIAQTLPNHSLNGISGVWSPSIIDTSNLGVYIYVFTPQSEQGCAVPLEIHVSIVTEIIPEFDFIDTYCQGYVPEPFPDISINGVIGVWDPPQIDTSVPGTTNYTFIPQIYNQCSDPIVKPIHITPSLLPEFNLPDSYCKGEIAEILSEVSDNGYHGSWSPTQIDTSQTGNTVYTFTPDPELGCSFLYTLDVNVSIAPTIVGFEIGTDNIRVNAVGGSENDILEYSMDGILWQQSPLFENLIPGKIYTFYVRGKCSMVSEEAVILNISNFISPNGDGINDYWEIRGANNLALGKIRIFDRYGKTLVNREFNGNYRWNGIYSGKSVQSGDYWYILEFSDNENEPFRKYVGHISVRN